MEITHDIGSDFVWEWSESTLVGKLEFGASPGNRTLAVAAFEQIYEKCKVKNGVHPCMDLVCLKKYITDGFFQCFPDVLKNKEGETRCKTNSIATMQAMHCLHEMC